MLDKNPRLTSPEYKKLSAEQKAMVRLELTLSHFVKTFEKSTARWERMIYPAMIVMALLGLSGFYLIYHVTKDMHTMSLSMDPNMESNLATMSGHMETMAQHISTMTLTINALHRDINIMVGDIHTMVGTMNRMDGRIANVDSSISHLDGSISLMQVDIAAISGKLDVLAPISINMHEMTQAIKIMTGNMSLMSRDMGMMNQNVSRPMNFMNSFAPW